MTRKNASFYLKVMLTISFFLSDSYVRASELVFGGALEYKPEYLGSSELSVNISPYIYWTDGQWFVDSENGVGIYKEFENGLYVSQALGYSLGRSDTSSWWRDGSEKLQGMGDVNASINSTTTFGMWITKWFGIEGEIEAPFTDSQGVAYRIRVNSLVYHDSKNSVILSVQQNYGDARFNTTWFGVSDTQSKQSGYSNFELTSGLNSVVNNINWNYMFSNKLYGLCSLTYTFIVDEARDSPIVKNKTNLSLSVGAYYAF